MKLYLLTICLLLSACTSLPPAFDNAPATDVTYNQARDGLARYHNTLVRWGGVIVSTEIIENTSLMEVTHYPLDHYGRPQLDETSEG